MSAFPYRYICLSFAEEAKKLLRGAKTFDSPVRHHVSKCLKPPQWSNQVFIMSELKSTSLITLDLNYLIFKCLSTK